jgi:hypothetical protein
MKKIILIVALVLALTMSAFANDYYNLSNWTPPHDTAFYGFVNSMASPVNLASWIASNCIYQINYAGVLSPYEFWKNKIGDCSEAAALSSYVGHQGGRVTYQVYILYTDGKAHRICIHRIDTYYGYLSFYGAGACAFYGFYNNFSFKKCVEDWDSKTPHTVKSYKVYDWYGNVIETG